MQNPDHLRAKRFAFILIPGFSLVCFSCAIDALRAANVETGNKTYSWITVAPAPGSVPSSSDIPIEVESLEIADDADVIVICGGDRSHHYQNRKLITWLQSHATQQYRPPERPPKIFGQQSRGIGTYTHENNLGKRSVTSGRYQSEAARQHKIDHEQDEELNVIFADNMR